MKNMGQPRITHTLYFNIEQEQRLAKLFEKIYGVGHPPTGNLLRDIIMYYCEKKEAEPLAFEVDPAIEQAIVKVEPTDKALRKYLDAHNQEMSKLLKSVGK